MSTGTKLTKTPPFHHQNTAGLTLHRLNSILRRTVRAIGADPIEERKLMNNNKIRVAFIGAGKQANWRHYPPISSMPDVELAALCDFHPDKADQTAEETETRTAEEETEPI